MRTTVAAWERLSRFLGFCASCGFLLPVGALNAAALNGETSLPCSGAVAWQEAHRDQLPPAMAQRDQSRTFGAPTLRVELQRRFAEDQRERRQLMSNLRDQAIRDRVLLMDRDNLEWLKKLVIDKGVPSVAQVGESGVHWTWLLVQHADGDPQFQSSLQPIFAQRHEAGELPADDLAKLTDRVLLAAGKPQRFGTQFDWYSRQFNPKGDPELAHIESNRQALGLMPLADYACMMNAKLKQE